MTVLLEQAIARMRTLPPDVQDDFARILLRLAGDSERVYALTAEEEADLIEADGEIGRGELATDGEIESVFVKYRRRGCDSRRPRLPDRTGALLHRRSIAPRGGACCAAN